MTSFNWVNDRLATGGRIDSQVDMDAMLTLGITHIVNCQAEFDDAQFLQGRHCTYLWNGCNDDTLPKPPELFKPTIEFVLKALTMPYTKIYIHCHSGSCRGPSAMLAVLRALGWADQDAFDMIKKVRPQADVNYRQSVNDAVKVLGYDS